MSKYFSLQEENETYRGRKNDQEIFESIPLFVPYIKMEKRKINFGKMVCIGCNKIFYKKGNRQYYCNKCKNN